MEFTEVRNVFSKRPKGFASIGTRDRDNFIPDLIVEFIIGLGKYINVSIYCVYK